MHPSAPRPVFFPGGPARVINVRSLVRRGPPAVSVIEIQSSRLPDAAMVYPAGATGWVLRLLGAELNMEPFRAPVWDGMVRHLSLAPAGAGAVECRVELEFPLDEPPEGPVQLEGLPAVTHLAIRREPLLRLLRGRRVGIDPAHGGKDIGARGPINLQERHVVLAIARRLAEHLEEGGCTVFWTRQEDVTLDDARRLRRVAQQGVEVLISLHTAHEPNPTLAGPRTLYAAGPGQQEQARALAEAVQAALVDRLGLPDRGVAPSPGPAAGGRWLHITVEVVCLANPYEEAFLRSSTFRDRVGQAIRNGLARFWAGYAWPAPAEAAPPRPVQAARPAPPGAPDGGGPVDLRATAPANAGDHREG